MTATLEAPSHIAFHTTVDDIAPARPRRSRPTDRVDFRLANHTETFDRAFRLVHDQYVDKGYMSPQRSGRRVNLRHALPSTRVFVAQSGPRVIGTVTLFRDSALGLPMDEVYRDELETLRAEGRQLAEASHLATDTDDAKGGSSLVIRMFRMLLLYAAEYARLDDVCLAVTRRHGEFYSRLLGCTPIGGVKSYGPVNGTPAVALRLDLHMVRERMADARVGRSRGPGVRSTLYDPDVLAELEMQLERDLPDASMTSRQFAHFFNGTGALDDAPPDRSAFVQSLHRPLDDAPAERAPSFSTWSFMNPGVPSPALVPA